MLSKVRVVVDVGSTSAFHCSFVLDEGVHLYVEGFEGLFFFGLD